MKDGRYFQLIDEEYVKTLPVKSFEGTIHLIDSAEKVKETEHLLASEKILGFDTETKPSFTKGKNNNVAMLQLACENHAFLFRLNKIKLPGFVTGILENPDIIKVGVAIKDDIKSLHRLRPFTAAGFVELQDFVKVYGIEDNGLKKLVANVLGFRISKKNQTSNWESPVLTPEQIIYAATDAWTCFKIYTRLI